MSTYVQAFLETEITVIPKIMDRYIGKYYNNALYNGITWMIFILHIIHFGFDLSVNALLKKMRLKEYVRIRLRKSLWYLGFYGCCFLYCNATLWKNNIKLPHRHKFQMLDFSEPISGHLILGYVLLSAFYASSSMWEGLQCSISSFTYLFLTGFVAFTYFLRYIELSILFTSTFSSIHVMTELTRCLFCIIKSDVGLPKLFIKFAFSISILTSIAIYFLIIPTSFVLPIARGFLKNPNSVILAGLNLTLWGWIICEIYSSPLYRLIQHRWYHGEKDEKVPDCVGTQIECALFLPRDDVAYNLKIIKREIEERQAKMMSMRKPKKGTSMLVQTLKCVAAINRKIKYRKLLEKPSPTTSVKLLDRKELPNESDEEVMQATINPTNESSTMVDEEEITNSNTDKNIISLDKEDLLKVEEQVVKLTLTKNRKDIKVQFIGIVEEDKDGQNEDDTEEKVLLTEKNVEKVTSEEE